MGLITTDKDFRNEMREVMQVVCAQYGVNLTEEDERSLRDITPPEVGKFLANRDLKGDEGMARPEGVVKT